jgi:hypothetical protein
VSGCVSDEEATWVVIVAWTFPSEIATDAFCLGGVMSSMRNETLKSSEAVESRMNREMIANARIDDPLQSF